MQETISVARLRTIAQAIGELRAAIQALRLSIASPVDLVAPREIVDKIGV